MNKLLGVKAEWFDGGLSIEINESGIVSFDSHQGFPPKILYDMGKAFKYGPNFIIRIYAKQINFSDDYIEVYKYKLNPINLNIISNWKTITYSGRSTTNLLSIRDDEIDVAFQSIDPITNPKFTAKIHGTDTYKIEYTCQADFHHCQVCPYRSQVVNCILGHALKIA